MVPVSLVLFLFSALAGASARNTRSTAAAYFLSGNKTDSCYDLPFVSDRAECILRFVTMYYEDYFMSACPDLANVLAGQKCKGCPWDKINASAITPAISRYLNRSELFHAAEPSCSVSPYLNGIVSRANRQHLNFFGIAIPLFCGMFLALSDRNGSPTTPQVFGSRLKEPIFFVFLWVLFFVGYGISVAGHEMDFICDGPLSISTLLIADWVNLAVMMWISLWRCRYLEARDRPQEVISWATYRESVLYRTSSVWRKRLVDSVCWGGPVLVLLSILFRRDSESSSGSFCQFGSYRIISYGLIQYSKILTAILAVGVYSLGPPRGLIPFYVRYCFLVIIMFVCVCYLYVMQLPVYETQSFSMLVPHVLDCEIAGPLDAELVAHSFAVALFGVAEPLRIGWPKRHKLVCVAGDTRCPESV